MASQITGATEIAVHTYQALYGQAASNALLNSYVSQIGTSDGYAWANSLAASLVATSNSDFATLLLTNLGITAATITASTAFPTPATTYTALQAALTEYLRANGVASRGTVAAQMAEQFSNMEGETTWGTYGAAATAFNAQSLANFTYSSNTANTVSAAVSTTTGQTYMLTAGIDTFPGTAYNDTFTNTIATGALSALDSLTGGNGTDTLNISDTAAIVTTAMGLTVTSMEVVKFTGNAGITADSTGWGTTSLTASNTTVGAVDLAADTTTAVTAVNAFAAGVTVTGGASQTITAKGTVISSKSAGAVSVAETAQGANPITVNGGTTVAITATGATTNAADVTVGTTTAPTGAVLVTTSTDSATGTHTSGAITVKGGSTVTITQNLLGTVNNTQTGDFVTVTGTAATTTVSVTQTASATAAAAVTGVADGDVNITDVNDGSTKADTITSVTVANFGNVNVKSAALTTLNISNTGETAGGTIGLNRTTDDTTANATTLTINATGKSSVGAISGTHAADFTTVNIAAAAATRIADVTFAAATSIVTSGAGLLTLTANTGIGAVTSITSGDGGLTLGTAIGTGVAYTGGAGADTLTVGATTKAVNVGAGDNVVTVAVSALGTGGSITAGAGTADTLSITATLADAADASTAFAKAVTGFEKLHLTTTTSQTVAADVLGNYNYVILDAATSPVLTGLTTGATVEMTGLTTGVTTTLAGAAVTATTDVQTIKLSAIGDLAAGTVTADKVETVNIVLNDTDLTSAVNLDSLGLIAAAVKSVVITGDGVLTLTNTDTTITSLDASGIIDHAAATGGGLTWVTGALAAANTITGTAAGTNIINWTSSVAAATTYVGGSGADVLVFTNAKANVITLGAGTNTVNNGGAAGTGNNTITGGAGNDTVNLLSGNNTVDLGNGTNEFNATSGNNTYTGGTGQDTVVVTTGSNTIHLGGGTTANSVTVGVAAGLNVIDTTSTGVDTVILSGIQTAAGYYTTVTGLAAGDKIDLTGVTTTPRADSALGPKITLGPVATFANYLDAATATIIADTGGPAVGAAKMAWFQFTDGNTYIVVDNVVGTGGTDTATFQDGVDTVICLTGLVTLTTAATVVDVITLV